MNKLRFLFVLILCTLLCLPLSRKAFATDFPVDALAVDASAAGELFSMDKAGTAK